MDQIIKYTSSNFYIQTFDFMSQNLKKTDKLNWLGAWWSTYMHIMFVRQEPFLINCLQICAQIKTLQIINELTKTSNAKTIKSFGRE